MFEHSHPAIGQNHPVCLLGVSSLALRVPLGVPGATLGVPGAGGPMFRGVTGAPVSIWLVVSGSTAWTGFGGGGMIGELGTGIAVGRFICDELPPVELGGLVGATGGVAGTLFLGRPLLFLGVGVAVSFGYSSAWTGPKFTAWTGDHGVGLLPASP